jgi:hypothetical protein
MRFQKTNKPTQFFLVNFPFEPVPFFLSIGFNPKKIGWFRQIGLYFQPIMMIYNPVFQFRLGFQG